jgi:uncharacterized protein (UPF0332 family)
VSSKSLSPELLRAFLDKANEKLTAARTMLEAGLFDDASSRAYYAAFHAVTAVLGTRGLSFSSHGQTIGAFNKEFVLNGRFDPSCFRMIQRLFKNRQVGDYDVIKHLDRSTAENDVKDAESIVNVCREYLDDCVPPSNH